MTIDWDNQAFRKLYERPSADFERLPFAVRCLASELLRRCDWAGRIVAGTVLDDKLVADVAFLVRAHDGEYGFLRAGLERLLSDSADPTRCYLVFRDGHLVVRNLSRAHSSGSARRMQRKRGRENGLACDEQPSQPMLPRPPPEPPPELSEASQASHPSQGVTPVTSVTAEPGFPPHPPSGFISQSGVFQSSDLSEASGQDLTGSAREAKNDPKKSPFKSDAERAVFEHWAMKLWPLVHKHGQPRATAQRLARIRGRLKDGFTVDDLKRVVDFVAQSPWHLGENASGKAYIEPETIFQNHGKVETWLTTRAGKAPGQVDHEERKRAELLFDQAKAGEWGDYAQKLAHEGQLHGEKLEAFLKAVREKRLTRRSPRPYRRAS